MASAWCGSQDDLMQRAEAWAQTELGGVSVHHLLWTGRLGQVNKTSKLYFHIHKMEVTSIFQEFWNDQETLRWSAKLPINK